MLDREPLALECSVQSAQACGLTAEVNVPPGAPQPQVRLSIQPAMQYCLLRTTFPGFAQALRPTMPCSCLPSGKPLQRLCVLQSALPGNLCGPVLPNARHPQVPPPPPPPPLSF